MNTNPANASRALSRAISRALIGGASLLPALANAQATSGASSAAELETIIVTATRREESILRVPYNISAVSGTQIDEAEIFDTAELLRSVPGVSTVDRGQRNAAVVNGIRIRGLNVDSSALGDYAVSGVSTVSTYVGDTPIFANFMLRDIERVEVLRGPQGTLYGSGALGGTVRYVMTRPKLEVTEVSLGGALSQVDGSDGVGYSADATVNLPVGETMAVRANLTRADYPGITDYVNLYRLDSDGIPTAPDGVLADTAEYRREKDADDVEIWYGRLSGTWQPTEAFDATLSYFFQQDDVGGRRQPTLGADGYGRPYRDNENGSIQLEPADREVDLGALEMNLDMGFASLTSSTSYYDHSGDSISENTGFYAQSGFLSFYYNYPRPMASALRSYLDRAFVQELRLVSAGQETLDYVVGVYYLDQSLRATQDSFLRGFKRWWDAAVPAATDAVSGDQDFIYRRNESYEEKALFGELTWNVSDRLRLTGGLRYFDNDSENDTLIDIPLYTALSQPTEAKFDASEDDVLLKANVSYRFGEDSLVYATFSEGYRRGGSNAVPTAGFFEEDPRWQLYVADTVTNYEIGVKGIVGGIRYDAAAFYVDWEDPQLNTATPNWGFYVVQNGEGAESQGLELQLSGALGDAWGWSFGYAWVDATLTDDFISPIGTFIQEDGARLPGVPEHTFNGALEYRNPIGGDRTVLARLAGYYQSETRNAISSSPLFDVDLDSFQIWDASVSLLANAWSASLWIKNIANEEGVTGVFTEAYMGTAPDEGYYGNGSKELISLPRTIGVSVGYSF